MNWKITENLVRNLLSLAQGEKLPASRLRSEISEELLKENLLCSQSNGSRIRYFVPDAKAFRLFLANKDDALKNLEATFETFSADETSRAEQVRLSGNSKIVHTRSCKGFLVNSYEPIPSKLSEKEFLIQPPNGTFVFIADYENFCLDENTLVVGMENMENFRYVEKQKYLFENLAEKILFVARYPQSGDLISWLEKIPNRYLHFGDLDLAGVHIYLTEFYSRLGERSAFFVPQDAEARICAGSRTRYDDQIQKFENMKIADARVLHVVDLIKRYHRGYDQEGFVLG